MSVVYINLTSRPIHPLRLQVDYCRAAKLASELASRPACSPGSSHGTWEVSVRESLVRYLCNAFVIICGTLDPK